VVGLRFRRVDEGAEVRWVHPQGPAMGALEAGDVVIAIEGRSLAGLRMREIGPLLTGQVGEGRRVRFRRGDEEREVVLVAVGIDALGAGGGGEVTVEPVTAPGR